MNTKKRVAQNGGQKRERTMNRVESMEGQFMDTPVQDRASTARPPPMLRKKRVNTHTARKHLNRKEPQKEMRSKRQSDSTLLRCARKWRTPQWHCRCPLCGTRHPRSQRVPCSFRSGCCSGRQWAACIFSCPLCLSERERERERKGNPFPKTQKRTRQEGGKGKPTSDPK